MAKLSNVTPALVEIKKVVVQPAEVTLTLSAIEVLTLRVILDHIGGDPKNSPRKIAQDLGNVIQAAARKLNLPYPNDDGITPGLSSIYFRNNTLDEFEKIVAKA